SNCASNLPEGGCLREIVECHFARHDKWQQDVAAILSRMSAERAPRRLNYVHTALLWISKHNTIDSWHVDALRQTPGIGHKSAIVFDKFPQKVTTLTCRLLA